MKTITWLDWSEESFEKSRSSRKPILLDIKGSWCHWCHVMDRTSYSDPAIIDIVNREFVPIRVDTDRRPDINRRYNLGGWPTTAFLDSKGEIITGGTYIPPLQLREILRSVSDLYAKNQGSIKSRLERPSLPKGSSGPLSERLIRDISTTVAVNFDIEYGGFGFEPKFPQPDALDLSMIRYRFEKESEMLKIVTRSLEMMGKGGIYDHAEKGFYRYSTTRDWSIPHFEKMAEDNAKLLGVYLRAYQLTGNTFYKQISQGILDYVNGTLSDQAMGGFYGSQDADEKYYGLKIEDRRKETPPAVDKTFYTNYNALFVSSYLLASKVLNDLTLANFALKTIERFINIWTKSGSVPHYWNGNDNPPENLLTDIAWLIHAFLDAYEYTGDKQYLEHSVRLANHATKTLRDDENGGFYDIPASNTKLGQLGFRDKPIDENSVMSLAFLRLSWLTGEETYHKVAETTLGLYSEEYERYGLMASTYAIALDGLLNGPVEIRIIGSQQDTKDLMEAAFKVYPARRSIQRFDPDIDQEKIQTLGYESYRPPIAYVCAKKTCGPPIKDAAGIITSVDKLLSQPNLTQAEIA